MPFTVTVLRPGLCVHGDKWCAVSISYRHGVKSLDACKSTAGICSNLRCEDQRCARLAIYLGINYDMQVQLLSVVHRSLRGLWMATAFQM